MIAPIVPTIKYPKVLLAVSPALLLYLLKEGIFVVGPFPRPLKGESKEEEVASVRR